MKIPASTLFGQRSKAGSRPASLKREAAWTAADTLVSSGLAFLFRLVIARFVAPAEFGVFAMALTTFAIVQVINEFGMAATVIQRSEERFNDDVVDTAYSASTIVSISLFLINLALIAPLSAWFYDSMRVGIVTAVIGVSFLFTPTVSIARALLFRQRDYRAVTIARIASTLASIALACVALALLRNVWALVVQIVAAQLFLAIAMHFVGSWRPRLRLRFNRAAFREMIGYSGLVFANDAFAAVSKNLDVIVLGVMLSQSEVGLYSMAFYITDVVRMNLASILNRVMFTQYSQIQNDLDAVRFYVVRTMSWNALIIFPFMSTLILAGPSVVPLIFGPAWSGMGTTLQVLAVAGIVGSSGGTAGTALKALGYPATELTIGVFAVLCVLIPVLIIGVLNLSLPGAAVAVLCSFLFGVIARHVALILTVKIGWFELVRPVALPLFAQIPIVAGWFLVTSFVPLDGFARAAAGIFTGLALYTLTVILIRDRIWKLQPPPAKARP